MRLNQDYKNAALARLRGNWAAPVVATLIFIIIAAACTSGNVFPQYINARTGMIFWFCGGSALLTILVINPLIVGYDNAMRLFYERGDQEVLSNMFRIATTNYAHKVAGMFLMELKVVLWTLLFFIPGIIMSFSYAMTPYILEEHPEIGAWDASTRSREIMRGHRFDLFWLYLSFIGWILLSILTLGIGLLWLAPYTGASEIAFYNDLKAEQGEASVAP
jgi:uncharacterized membrane protein